MSKFYANFDIFFEFIYKSYNIYIINFIYEGKVIRKKNKPLFNTILNSKDDDNEYFVHNTEIKCSSDVYRKLYPGEYVQYSLNTDDDGKTTAVGVTGIEGGPLLCETRHRLNQQKSEYKKSRQNETEV